MVRLAGVGHKLIRLWFPKIFLAQLSLHDPYHPCHPCHFLFFHYLSMAHRLIRSTNQIANERSATLLLCFRPYCWHRIELKIGPGWAGRGSVSCCPAWFLKNLFWLNFSSITLATSPTPTTPNFNILTEPDQDLQQYRCGTRGESQ